MPLESKYQYEFGEFRLNPVERILSRGSEDIELTPKGFELLTFLVENHGRLLSKDELMEKIWADSFVEDSNLTFNIRQLRVILGDDAQEPKYIKTVRGHGYRFIADVRRVSAEIKPETAALNGSKPPKTASDEKPSVKPQSKNFFLPILAASTILIVAAVAVAFWWTQRKTGWPNAPVLFAPFVSEKLSTNGKVVLAAISPDGKKMVYVNGTGNDKESVWLRQLEDGSNTNIIPVSDDFYLGLTVSPDGETLYFVRKARQTDKPPAIYRTSIFGGIPQKIVEDVEGWINISPDGKKISFVRRPRRDEENAALWIADASDGKNERKVVARPRPFRISDSKFSADGKRITFAVGQSENAGNEFGLSEVDLETGAERELTTEKFFVIHNIARLPDESGWLLTGARIPNKSYRIWQVSARTGEAVPLTKDSENYRVLSLDKDATKIVSTQFKQDFRLRLVNLENSVVSRPLADASNAAFAPDGKIYFSSLMSGNDEIWSINTDGSGLRQLTNTKEDEGMLVVSPDDNTVFFTSNRTGAAQIWRMNTDGSNQTQVTNKEGGFPMLVSSGGEWVYYIHGLNRTLWRVSSKTGEEQMVFDKTKPPFAVSPDGLQIAYTEKQGDETILIIATPGDGKILKTFHLPDKKLQMAQMIWMPDGKNLAYVTTDQDNLNKILWTQAFSDSAPKQITALGDEELGAFPASVSPDGKTFAFTQGGWLHDAVLLKGLR